MLMKALEKARRVSPRAVYRLLQMSNNVVTSDTRFMELYWQLVREGTTILSIKECYNIRFYLAGSLRLGGAVAELGVYKGGGAKLICEYKGDAPLHLFDTFEGMPEVDGSVDVHRAGDFSDTDLAGVKAYLGAYERCVFHKGEFPGTTAELPDDAGFCFVHLDADLYESTLSGLEYFYPRLKRGGVIISHDYNATTCPGVRRAFDEYFRETPGDVMILWDTQCLVKKPASAGGE
jgi:O-methyltransferase